MSHLKNKSNDLIAAAKLLDVSKLYPAVAHSAYYCCILLMKQIWLHSLHKTESDLTMQLTSTKKGTHEFLINQIGIHIKSCNTKDFLIFNRNIVQLKRLRVNADYLDNAFGMKESNSSLTLSNLIVPILQKY
ncbi:MAG: hypothetical protein FWD09_05755 [Lentimicrobiaceae bacterium]|nr:hypothetical protein [Lentimicrobiaceae bacterium]